MCCVLLAFLILPFSPGAVFSADALSEELIDVDELKSWLKIFEDDPFFKEAEPSTQKRHASLNESSDFDADELLRTISDIFQSQIRFFPANKMMIQAMYKMMKPNGVLNKEGFAFSGQIHTNGEASILFSRPFHNEQDLIEVLKKSIGKRLTDIDVAIGAFDQSKPLVVVTNYIMNKKNIKRLIHWLEKKQKENGNHVRHSLVGRRVVMIVTYSCCAKTVIPALAPKYGSIRLMIG